ncbi:hypothetical protein SNEBB_005424 [Seison nebaliae]|nr:hypothetical protein SNEBB_005424 [Seison nebaliae]
MNRLLPLLLKKKRYSYKTKEDSKNPLPGWRPIRSRNELKRLLGSINKFLYIYNPLTSQWKVWIKVNDLLSKLYLLADLTMTHHVNVSLNSVKTELYHPKLPTFRQIDRHNVMGKLSDEHCRHTLSVSKDELSLLTNHKKNELTDRQPLDNRQNFSSLTLDDLDKKLEYYQSLNKGNVETPKKLWYPQTFKDGIHLNSQQPFTYNPTSDTIINLFRKSEKKHTNLNTKFWRP